MHAQRIFYSFCTIAVLAYCGLYYADHSVLPPHGRFLATVGGCTCLAALFGFCLHFFLGRTKTNRSSATLRSGATESSFTVEKGIRWWLFILPIPFYREIYSVKDADYEVEIRNGEVTKLEHLGRQLDPNSEEGESIVRLAEPVMHAACRRHDRDTPGWLN